MLLNQRYYTILNLVVLTVLIYSAVDIFYTLVGSNLPDLEPVSGPISGPISEQGAAATKTPATGTTPQGRRPFDEYRAAIDRDLFGVAQQQNEAAREKEFNVDELEQAALKATLLGTVSGNSQAAVAVIQEGTKKTQSLYKEGDAIQNATILKIERGAVIVKVGEKTQKLTMEEKPTAAASPKSAGGAEPASDRKITLDRSVVAGSLDNITELMSQVRVRPHYKDGKPDGLILSQVRPDSLITEMGLRNGDIVQQVNGKPITNAADVTQFYQELRAGSSVSLDISRRGKSETLNYTFR